MAIPTSIEAVRNRKTQKLFIIVDDTLGTRYKLINPSGELLILPDLLFEEDTIAVPADQIPEEFTPEQLEAFSKHLEYAAEKARIEASKPPMRHVPTPPPTPKRHPPKKRTTNTIVKTGLGSSWSAPRLTFYKHKIEPLHLKQSFKVTVEGAGDFILTKEDFLRDFNDVVMSPSYRSEGLFTYREIPDKAKRYLRN